MYGVIRTDLLTGMKAPRECSHANLDIFSLVCLIMPHLGKNQTKVLYPGEFEANPHNTGFKKGIHIG